LEAKLATVALSRLLMIVSVTEGNMNSEGVVRIQSHLRNSCGKSNGTSDEVLLQKRFSEGFSAELAATCPRKAVGSSEFDRKRSPNLAKTLVHGGVNVILLRFLRSVFSV